MIGWKMEKKKEKIVWTEAGSNPGLHSEDFIITAIGLIEHRYVIEQKKLLANLI